MLFLLSFFKIMKDPIQMTFYLFTFKSEANGNCLFSAFSIATCGDKRYVNSEEGFKYFIGYQESETVKPLCIILPQMSGYIKYFKNGGKNMSFFIKDEEVWEKYEQIWDVIKIN